jgi:hypothetical protein
MSEMRTYVQQQRALGTSRFQAVVEQELQRVVTVRPRGWRRESSGMPGLTMNNVSDPFCSIMMCRMSTSTGRSHPPKMATHYKSKRPS